VLHVVVLGARGDPSRFDGSFRTLVAGLNGVLDAVVAPITITTV